MLAGLKVAKMSGFKGDGDGKWNFGSNETPFHVV